MKLYTLFKVIEKNLNSRCLSCEGEIIAYLHERGPSRAVEIIIASRHSDVNVFKKLKELKQIGALIHDKSIDIDAKKYDLSDDIKSIIKDNFS